MNVQSEEEISLGQLFEIFREKKRVIFFSVLLCTATALVWALLRAPQYSWQACESIGLIGRNSRGDPIHASSASNAIAQIENGYLPSELVRFNAGQPKNDQMRPGDFHVTHAKRSSVVCLSGLRSRAGSLSAALRMP